jgi:hypothetical protein
LLLPVVVRVASTAATQTRTQGRHTPTHTFFLLPLPTADLPLHTLLYNHCVNTCAAYATIVSTHKHTPVGVLIVAAVSHGCIVALLTLPRRHLAPLGLSSSSTLHTHTHKRVAAAAAAVAVAATAGAAAAGAAAAAAGAGAAAVSRSSRVHHIHGPFQQHVCNDNGDLLCTTLVT